MKILRLFLLSLLLGGLGAAHAQPADPQAPFPPLSSAPSKAKAKPKPESAEVLLTRARKLKAQGHLDAARREIYKIYDRADDDENFNIDPRASYTLAWIDVATHHRSDAIGGFRSALASGLKGREAFEARAALHRMGVSEHYPRFKPRPRSLLSSIRSTAMMADLFKPSPVAWAVQTAVIALIVAVIWAFVIGAQLLASGERWGKRDWITLLGWVAALVAMRAMGQFVVSFRYILPLAVAYFLLQLGQFLSAFFYGARRLTTKKVMDKGGIRILGAFYTLMLLIVGGGATGLSPYFTSLMGGFIVWWLASNVGLLCCYRAGQFKNKGDIARAVTFLESVRGWKRLGDRSRFAVTNDLASMYAGQNNPRLALERGQEALRYVHAWKSAEVLVRANLAEALLSIGQRDAAIDQLSHVWHLTETADCLNGPAQWRGATHGILAEINFWRGWMDEANRQADLCLEAFPPELRGTPTAQNLVAISRAIKGAAALAAGDLPVAQKYMEIAPKTQPKRGARAFVLFLSSTVRAAAGDADGAFAEANAALEASPGYFPAVFQRAHLLRASGRPEEAKRLLVESLPRHERNHLAPQARALLRELGVAAPEPAPLSHMPWEPEASAPLILTQANTSSASPVTI